MATKKVTGDRLQVTGKTKKDSGPSQTRQGRAQLAVMAREARVSSSRTSAKTSPRKTAKSGSGMSEVHSERSSKSSMFPKFKLNKKTSAILLSLGAFVLLMILANKYFVVAWVDKKPITRIEYYKSLDKRYGKDLREELIVEKLINAEAANKKVNVTNDETAAEIKKIEEQQGGPEKLEKVLALQNLSRDDLRGLVRLQLLRAKIFSGGDVSEDEVNKYMESNKEALTAENPDASPEAQLAQKAQVKEQPAGF